MNELMQKIAEKLSLSVDKAPEIYESLKTQFALYDICNYFICALGTASVFVVFGLLINYVELDCSIGREERVFHKKITKYLLITLAILMIVITCIYIFRNLYTSDIVFLREIVVGG